MNGIRSRCLFWRSNWALWVFAMQCQHTICQLYSLHQRLDTQILRIDWNILSIADRQFDFGCLIGRKC